MEVKIYSINDCKYCDTLKTVLLESFIPFIEVKVRRLSEVRVKVCPSLNTLN